MAFKPRPLIAGNWKMFGLRQALSEIETIAAASASTKCHLLICPPATLLLAASQAVAGSGLAIGGQDCHPLIEGPYTGDISAPMLKDAGATYVILGHSERRITHCETDAFVKEKVQAAYVTNLLPIICVGESKAERDAGKAFDVVAKQIKGSVPTGIAGDTITIAYEPVWAIGTGLTPTIKEIADMHSFIRTQISAHLPQRITPVRILYGGSVKPANSGEILALENVNGALVGGASLSAKDFLAIAASCPV
jgi:triosephosphate isomerase